jgi:hypothetical protein
LAPFPGSAGKEPGIFRIFRVYRPVAREVAAKIQRLTEQIPVIWKRELFAAYREIRMMNRELMSGIRVGHAACCRIELSPEPQIQAGIKK